MRFERRNVNIGDSKPHKLVEIIYLNIRSDREF